MTYGRMADHFGIGILPARPYRPRDKAKVEAGVRIAQTYVLGRLRNQRFDSACAEWTEELRASTASIEGLSQRTEEALTAALGRVQLACDGMVREVGAALQTQLTRSMIQAQREWGRSLDETVSVIRQAARDTARARLWAVVAAAITRLPWAGVGPLLTDVAKFATIRR